MGASQESRLFLSYRRDDAEGQAGRLYDRLNAAFPGRVFRDVSGIEIGVDFARAIQEAIASSVAFVAVIGKQWLGIVNPQGERRILQPNDYVRLEIATALERRLRVIPVLVDGAKMPAEEDLPSDIQPLARIQAIELTVTDYDHLVERLIGALEANLGKRADADRTGHVESLVKRAEVSMALEDWMGAIQMLQSALSLDPTNTTIASRLRFAQVQLQLAGLYTDGQQRYQNRDKAGALERFRQARAAGGSYKNVEDLIVQLEAELRGSAPLPPKKKSGWGKWALAVLAVLALIGYAVQERPLHTGGGYKPENPQQYLPTQQQSAEPVRQAEPASSTQPPEPETQATAPPSEPTEEEFSPDGRWDLYSEMNPTVGLVIVFAGNGQFAVQTRAGYYQFPASAGQYQYNGANHLLIMTGVNNMGFPFREAVQILGRHGDHFHAFYSGTEWALKKAQF